MLPPREIRSLKLKSWHYSLELKNRILFSRNFPQFFAIEGSKVEEVKSLKEDIEIPLQIYCENEVETWKRVPRQRRSFATDFFRSWRIFFSFFSSRESFAKRGFLLFRHADVLVVLRHVSRISYALIRRNRSIRTVKQFGQENRYK